MMERMRQASILLAFALVLAGSGAPAVPQAASPQAPPPQPVPVTPENFPRAESDLNFASVVKEAGLGKFVHRRDPVALDHQGLVRMNRDTLYSAAVFDLDAGPVAITLPDAGKRFVSMQIVDEDADTFEVVYGSGATTTLTRQAVGSRYALAAVRIFVDAGDPRDVDAVRALQGAIKVEQPGGPGAFVVPNWEAASQVDVRAGLTALAETLPDTRGLFGRRGAGDPVRRLIGAGAAWGGLPEQDELFVNVVPARNDGKTVNRLTLKDVPVDGFWSVSVYDADGRFAQNPQKSFTVNSVTGEVGPDGAIVIQFGGCDGHIPNCLPTPPDWSYVVRLYRPRAELVDGTWKLPEAEPLR